MRRTKVKPRTVSGGSVSADVMRAIILGARDQHIVRIQYIDKSGAMTVRDTEPYDIKDGKYWGYCLERQDIRQFILSSIVNAIATTIPYSPRYPVNIF